MTQQSKIFYRLGDKGKAVPFKLTKCDDKLIIRTENDFDPTAILAREVHDLGYGRIQERESFPEASVVIFDLLDYSGEDVVNEIKAAIRQLDIDEIKYIGSLWKNENQQYQIYTGNVFINFKSDLQESQCLKILEENGLKKKQKIKLEEDSYFVEPYEKVGSDIFEICINLVNRNDVEICTPEIVVKRKTIQFKREKGNTHISSEHHRFQKQRDPLIAIGP
jgi:hypothetical protein